MVCGQSRASAHQRGRRHWEAVAHDSLQIDGCHRLAGFVGGQASRARAWPAGCVKLAKILHRRPITKQNLRALIGKLGGRTIAFTPAYAHLPSLNVNSALLLSQMVFWVEKGKLEEGWIYKTRQDWVEETH